MIRKLIFLGLFSVAFGFGDEFKVMFRVLEECTADGVDTSPCLKLKVISALDRAARSVDLEILDGVHLIGEEDRSPPTSEKEIAASLPRSLDDKESALDDIIMNKVARFVQTRSVQFKLSNLNEIPRELGIEEGRRRKKGGALLMYMFMMLGTMIPIKLGTLALLAGKALIISKLALALAGIVALKKLLSGHGGHESSYQVVQVPSHGHRRSIDLPYRAYQPSN